MATNPSLNRSAVRREVDPFAMQLALSTVHARLVPMRRGERGYELDPSTAGWFELPAGRGFAGYGLGRALRMLLDVLRGLTALHDTFDATGENFAHGDVSLSQLRVDNDGVCRLVPLTARHSLNVAGVPTQDALGHLAPERLLGEAVDARSDVFSGGALLWEALAGRRLFEETTGDAIIDRLMGEKLQMPQLPPELAWAIPLKAVAARALAVDPYQRFADCSELATAIAIVARERVATHAEMATFFGAPPRSAERRIDSVRPSPDESALSALMVPSSGRRLNSNEGSQASSLPSRRPVPTRSSTFPAAVLPVPSSRRSSTLAPLGPARSLTPPPSQPNSMPPVSTRQHVSPFSALLSAEQRAPNSAPASSGRGAATVMSLGTPAAALESIEAAPESSDAPRSSARPPALPLWAQAASTLPAPSISTTPAIVEPAAMRPTQTTLDEVAAIRGASKRRTWLVVGFVALGGALAWGVVTQLHSAPDGASPSPLATAKATPVAVAPPVAPPSPAVEVAAPASDAPAHVAPSTPAPRPAPPRALAKSSQKDYGI